SGPSGASHQSCVPHVSRTAWICCCQRSTDGIHAISSVGRYVIWGSTRINDLVRSGYVAAKSDATIADSYVAMIDARSDLAAFNTARTSSVRVSTSGTWPGVKRSEQPQPRRSVTIRRANALILRRNRARWGLSQFISTFEQ